MFTGWGNKQNLFVDGEKSELVGMIGENAKEFIRRGRHKTVNYLKSVNVLIRWVNRIKINKINLFRIV